MITSKKPNFTGIKSFDNYLIEEISKFINWTMFFKAWKLNGIYPHIFNDPEKGQEAKKLFSDAQDLLDRIIKEKTLKAKAVFGIFPANSIGNDIEIYSEINKNNIITKFHFLRNQEKKKDNEPNLCLSDFIIDKGKNIDDYIGCFAATTGLGIEKYIKEFEADNDDYNIIMVKIIADRLVEAFSELLHYKVRTEYWGYEENTEPNITEILKGRYTGIRPAPGYSACPEHSEKKIIFELLQAEEKTNISLTENSAMNPAASVCGYYFASPKAKYFNIGKIGEDQLLDYAKRKNISVKEAEKYLALNLNYK